MLYFTADDGSTGREVWRLDLTDFLFHDDFE
jgi:ELWxxDGT repeat protein